MPNQKSTDLLKNIFENFSRIQEQKILLHAEKQLLEQERQRLLQELGMEQEPVDLEEFAKVKEKELLDALDKIDIPEGIKNELDLFGKT